ncbi:MAG: alpha/beta hydrolase [Thermodesulfobacteriota bacterium]
MKKLLAGLLAVIIALVVATTGFLYLAPEKFAATSFDLTRKICGLERKELTLPGGEKYVYLEGGKGEPLLLLHGFGANKDNFTFVARNLTKTCHVIVPDHIGFGESSHPAEADYSSAAQAERLHRFINALGLSTIHIGGSSMGGLIAMRYAVLYPGEVKSMWLLAPGGIWSAPESDLRRVIRETGENPLIAKNEDEFARTYDFAMSRPPFIPRPVLDVMAQERIRNVALEKRIFEQIKADSVEEAVRGLTTPALIVWGEEDRAISAATAPILVSLLPNSQAVVMKGIGHLPMIEAPGAAARDYLEFRAGL